MFSGTIFFFKFFWNILATALKSYIITILQKELFAHKKLKKVEKIGIITSKCSERTTSLVTFGINCAFMTYHQNRLAFLKIQSWENLLNLTFIQMYPMAEVSCDRKCLESFGPEMSRGRAWITTHCIMYYSR